MPDKTLQKKCPRCCAALSASVPDDDFLEANIRLFKLAMCDTCGKFAKDLARINELKQDAWAILNRDTQRLKKLKNARAVGSTIENLSLKIADLEQGVDKTRTALGKLDEKEQDVSQSRALHEQQLKER